MKPKGWAGGGCWCSLTPIQRSGPVTKAFRRGGAEAPCCRWETASVKLYLLGFGDLADTLSRGFCLSLRGWGLVDALNAALGYVLLPGTPAPFRCARPPCDRQPVRIDVEPSRASDVGSGYLATGSNVTVPCLCHASVSSVCVDIYNFWSKIIGSSFFPPNVLSFQSSV